MTPGWKLEWYAGTQCKNSKFLIISEELANQGLHVITYVPWFLLNRKEPWEHGNVHISVAFIIVLCSSSHW